MTLFLRLPLAVLILLAGVHPASAQWTSLPSGTGTALEAVWALDSSTILIAGENGVLRRSTDAGANWTDPVTGFFDDINDFVFPTPLTGYAAGDDGTLLKTTDGGLTWTISATATVNELKALHFLDADHGFAATEAGEILETTDGGSSWSTNYTAAGIDWQDLYFPNPGIGIAVGENAGYARSADGGATWSAPAIGTAEDLNGIAFVAPDTGWITGDGVLLHTDDAGASWSIVSFPVAGDLNSAAATGGSVFACGEAGVAVRLVSGSDPGGSWENLAAPAGGELNAMYMLDPCLGYFAGDGGRLLRWYDGTACAADTSGPDTTSTGIGESVFMALHVYPVPFRDRLTVAGLDPAQGPCDLLLTDPAGRVRARHAFVPEDGGRIEWILPGDLAPGVYRLVVRGPNGPRGAATLVRVD